MGTGKKVLYRAAMWAASLTAMAGLRILAKKITPGKIQQLRNRAALTREFFRATKVHGTIHQVEMDFIYLDGDRGLVKRISGLWTHDSEQPDVLQPVPRNFIARGSPVSHFNVFTRIATQIAREDRRNNAPSRRTVDVLTKIAERRAASYDRSSAPEDFVLGAVEADVREAYDRAYAAYPGWPIPLPVQPAESPA